MLNGRNVRVSLLASVGVMGLAVGAQAANFTLTSNSTTAQTVNGGDTGTINPGVSLTTTGGTIPVTWSLTAGATPTALTTINNSGTINASGSARGFDTSGTATGARSLTFNNIGAASVLKSTSDALRVNSDIGAGALTINNAGTIQGAQAIDVATVGSTTKTTTTVISNAAGAFIQSTTDDAIHLPVGGMVTLNNQGTIQSTAASSRAIDVNPTSLDNLVSLSLVNGSATNSTALISSAGDTFRLAPSNVSAASLYQISIDNFGTIQSTGIGANNGQALDFDKLSGAGSKVTITNETTGVIKAVDADAIRPGGQATINNQGLIQAGFNAAADGSGSNSSNDAIDFQSNKGGVVNNGATGTIDGARDGITAKYAPTITNAGMIIGRDGSGINIDTSRDATPANPDITATGTVIVNNTGTIIGTALTADGDAIDVDYLVNVTNSGTIKAAGIVNPAVGSLNEALAIGGGSVVNQAGGVITSDQRAITVDDSNLGNAFGAITIDNFGTITGSDSASGGIGGIKITSNVSNTLTNEATGIINGSVMLGSGNDTVNLYAGSQLNGALDGGGGADTLNLQGTGAGVLSSTITNIQTLNVNSGVWTVTSSLPTVSNTIAAGATLQVGNGGTAGAVAGDVTDNGTLSFNHSNAVTFANAISGSGGLADAGTGVLTLTGANTFTGATTINSGATLNIGGGGATGSLFSTSVVDNGTFVLNRSNSLGFNGVISGSGTLVVASGSNALRGDNTYTGGTVINAGASLQLGVATTTGSILGNVVDNGALNFSRTNAYTFAGIISGSGSVGDLGAGVVTLTGNSSYTGGTAINAGSTLQVGAGGTSGAITGAVTDNGALIFNRSDAASFTGTVSGSGSVTDAGTGVLTLSGSFTQTGGTILNPGATISLTAGSTLSAANGVTWALNGAGSGVATITNAGTITGSTRGITTSGSGSPRSITVTNSGTITGTGNDGFQIGNDVGAGTVNVTNSGTIKSAGGQAIDFAAITAGTGTVNITNAAGGVITSSADDALRPGAGTVTINNQGSITSTAAANRAINVNPTNLTNLVSFTITNGAATNNAALIQSAGDAVRFTASTLGATATYNVALDNFGTIKSTGTGANNGQALDFNDLTATGGKVTITNEVGGVISSADADAIRPGANATVNNSGLIQSSFVASIDGTGNLSGNDAIDFQSDKGGVVNNSATGTIDGAKSGITAKYAPTITNAGTIIGRDGSGINIDTSRDATPANPDITATGIVTVNNTGTIIGTANTADGDAIDVDYLVNVTNSGTIKAVGIVNPSVGSLNEALAIGGGSVINQAGGVITSDQRAITVDDSNLGNAFGAITIDNAGTITGNNANSNGIGAISITSNVANTLINRATGVINGNVVMGSGNDSVTLYAGETLNGMLNGGAGTDTITLTGTGTGTLANVSNFEALSVTSGSWSLTDTQAYANGVNVSGGTLNVTGTVTGPVTVASGATLTGTGKVGAVSNAGTFTPGSAFTVGGNLTLASTSNYIEAITPTTANLTTVTGSAAVGGTFTGNLAQGAYTAGKRYTVLTAAGGVTGAFATTTVMTPTYVKPTLSYDSNNVYLTLSQVFLGGNLASGTTNQKAVAGALDTAVTAGFIPTNGVLALYGLSGAALNGAIDQISGQLNSNVSNAVGESFLSFLTLMTPGDGVDGGRFAPGQAYNGADAPARAQLAPGQAHVWASVYGGTADLDGKATSGAAGLSGSNVGFAAGVDAKLDASLLAGLTVGVGHQDFNSGNGTGNSDDVMLGGYLRESIGDAYLSGSIAYGWHSIGTSRVVTVAGTDVLNANFDAHDIGGRIEAGWRVPMDDVTLTPYGAWTSTAFYAPAYAETAASGVSTFALSYAARSTQIGRTELGAKFGRDFDWGDSGLTANLTAAWAHQLDDTPYIQASFAGIASSGFQVIGTHAAADSALLGGELKGEGRGGLSYGVKVESQLGAGTTIFEGMGTVGWRW